MDPLQDNLIHFHWQDVISDKEECSGEVSECTKKWGCPGEDGGERSLIRKMLKMMTYNGERSHCATSRVGGEVI